MGGREEGTGEHGALAATPLAVAPRAVSPVPRPRFSVPSPQNGRTDLPRSLRRERERRATRPYAALTAIPGRQVPQLRPHQSGAAGPDGEDAASSTHGEGAAGPAWPHSRRLAH